ncbi:DM13 domain-containing protein [Pararhodonellum marinum]|uniref:DM13 domain-containing protein n=1 Tax=Pararhodonellum marinum TaxID=2755358 RepID=UPI0018900438|nr:DM13 domain-containing protein [Pararhodonellum marinum]
MKKIFLYTLLIIAVSCSNDESPTVLDASRPNGTFSVTRSGSFIDQNGAGSMGTASLGTDTQNTAFLVFDQSFRTALATGTVTVFLSTSETFTPDPANGNPNLLLLGPVRNPGENFFRIPQNSDTSPFSHVILWCGSVGVPFGYARIQ